jgi:hypothetical protein
MVCRFITEYDAFTRAISYVRFRLPLLITVLEYDVPGELHDAFIQVTSNPALPLSIWLLGKPVFT